MTAAASGAPPSTACLQEATLLRYVGQQLDAMDAARVERHLDGCAACLDLVAALGRLAPPSAAVAPSTIAARSAIDSGDRYEVGEEIARGGMGRILDAWDRVLDRPVALKTLRSTTATEAVARFEREMSLTARLVHPAIIAIHDAGVLPDGRPFYAMSRVGGTTLQVRIEACASTTERMALIPAIEQLVDAVAYAHAQGVIHRDLKPDNVLIGTFGETVLLDWGLAKVLGEGMPDGLGEADVRASEEAGSGATGRLGSDAEHATRQGQVLGTPGYIAPEVLAGEGATKRSDVYSLGVVLARLLTTDPARPTENAPPALTAVAPDIPADLVAITARAIDPDPAARYRDAAEVSADLRRFGAGQRVAARRYTAIDRIRRFAARHRAPVAVAAIAAVLLIGGGIVSARGLVRANTEAQTQRAEAMAQRQVAEDGRQAAEGLIDFVLRDLVERLEAVGRLDALGGVADAVDAYYERASVAEGEAGAAALTRRGRALQLAARVRVESGDLTAAIETARRALEALGDADRRKSDEASRQRLARSHVSLADLFYIAGDNDAARVEAERGLALAEAGLAHAADSPQWNEVLTVTLSTFGRVHLSVGDVPAAVAALERANGSAAKTVDLPGQPTRADRLRNEIGVQLGFIAMQQGDGERAIAALSESVAAARRNVQRRPEDPATRRELGYALQHHGIALTSVGRTEAARTALQEALATVEALHREDPSNTGHLGNLSTIRGSLSGVFIEEGDLPRALTLQQQALQTAAQCHALDPDDVRALFNRGAEASNLAFVERKLGRLDAALRHSDEALGWVEQALAQVPDDPNFVAGRVATLLEGGLIRAARGDKASARQWLARAEALPESGLQADFDELRAAVSEP